MLPFVPARLQKVAKFVISGGTAAVVNLATLYACTEFLHWWYVLSAVAAFLVSFVVSFTLQKFWTFSERTTDTVHHQVAASLTIAGCNLFLSTALLYFIVEATGLHYLLAQILVQGCIALVSFFLYGKVVFAKESRIMRKLGDAIRRIRAYIPLPHLALLAGCVFALVSMPLFATLATTGFQPLRVSVGAYADSGYYADRITEIKDGHPLMGNPYFIEHREDLPPAFFVADWIAAVPYLIGIPLYGTIYIDFLFWSLVLAFLLYAILRALGVQSLAAVIGSVFAFLEVYAYMMPLVSMQIVYPFFALFLLAYLLWLQDAENVRRQLFLAVAASLSAYIYTYSIQIAVVVLGLIGLLLLYRKDYRTFRIYFRTGLVFVALSLPLIVFSIMQIRNPLYFETMARIGLVHTHLPITHALFVVFVPALMLALAMAVRQRGEPLPHLRDVSVPVVFFLTTGLALVIVSLSNVITGTDLELPQHIERFVIVWFALLGAYFFSMHRGRVETSLRLFPKKIFVAALLGCCVFVTLHYFSAFGARSLFTSIDMAAVNEHESYAPALAWLRDTVQEPAVVWADPASGIGAFIPRLTPHYVLFSGNGVLQLMSNGELEERYLVAHYFSLSEEQLEDEYIAYAGTGNAVHQFKTHNRKVQACRLLMLDTLGYDCGKTTTMVQFKGSAYFDKLFKRYEKDIRPHIGAYLKKYAVSYIIADASDTEFHPEKLPGTREVFSDGRFTIFQYEQR